MNLESVKIESINLIQIPISMDYCTDIYKEFTKDIVKYMYPKEPLNIKETQYFIKDSIERLKEGNNLQLVIIDKSNNAFIGCSGLHGIGRNDPELGIWIKRKSQGNGYGRESIHALIKWARENITFEYLKYPVDKRNVASRKIPEDNNGLIMNEYKKINQNGFELDIVEYWIR